ncbi:hypothetical protein HY085_02160 [Candidatus Gottesmanbacteria bacterium]|nr:hypothetical protein [Candidatus Gottesmanbacteria bacterium]
MASLTETAFITRKTLSIGVILLVLLIVARIIIGFSASLWQKFFPPPPPPPTLAFGRLPYPNAENNLATPSGNISYTLETPDGGFPKLPPTVKVYFMPAATPSFGSFDKMKATANGLGFTDIPVRVGPTTWKFTDKDNPLRTLDIDEVSQNFHLVYGYQSDLSLFNDKNFTSAEQVIASAQSFFTSLKDGRPSVYYYKLDAGGLVPTTALANADGVGVSLARPEIDGLPVVSPDWRQGLYSILYSGASDQKKKILEARYFAAAIDLQNWATYPLISAADAFEKLKSRQAIFASLVTSQNITIRKVYLAYLDPYPAQRYLQPVLVFSDEKGFVAYVPIVSQ